MPTRSESPANIAASPCCAIRLPRYVTSPSNSAPHPRAVRRETKFPVAPHGVDDPAENVQPAEQRRNVVAVQQPQAPLFPGGRGRGHLGRLLLEAGDRRVRVRGEEARRPEHVDDQREQHLGVEAVVQLPVPRTHDSCNG
jgi:hypothetical protein